MDECCITQTPMAMAELLLAQGVHADGVHMPDWRAGDCAPSAGQKVAIMGRMRKHPTPGDNTDIAAVRVQR